MSTSQKYLMSAPIISIRYEDWCLEITCSTNNPKTCKTIPDIFIGSLSTHFIYLHSDQWSTVWLLCNINTRPDHWSMRLTTVQLWNISQWWKQGLAGLCWSRTLAWTSMCGGEKSEKNWLEKSWISALLSLNSKQNVHNSIHTMTGRWVYAVMQKYSVV